MKPWWVIPRSSQLWPGCPGLVGGLMANLTVLNEAAFWFAVAAFAFGLTANATR